MKCKGILLAAILQAWTPITDASALGLTDPRLCYILDGILLIYAIIITACFVKLKISKGSPEPQTSQNSEDLYNRLSHGTRDEYASLGAKQTDADIEVGGKAQHRRKQAQDRVYSALQRDKMAEAYSEIGKKGERRRGKGSETVYQGLSKATKDTYDVLQMQPLPPPY
ncbi:T-cell surface glycoprotein CD3 zeta chain isoform X1 [Podarcis lilfordi]|uniref:T-cell surface glycoprotein CD3 zeta chain n=1 Tax=Podarcis lilfordi TaxID=74358 RepID=A0AA35K9L5_9SAUR|nr:T-cell surface glycoprotein CD3 zeta chain isoform X1 [Podarcis lilfordi]